MKPATLIFFSLFIFLIMLTPKDAEADRYKAIRHTQITWTVSMMALFYPALYFKGRSKNQEMIAQCPQWFLLAYCDANLNYCTDKQEDGKAAVCIKPNGSKNDTLFPSYNQAADTYRLITPMLFIAGALLSAGAPFIFWAI